jgi:hypothetical protein
MAGPAFYSAVVNIAKNEDWVVPFQYGTLSEDETTIVGINLSNSVLKLEMRIREADHEAVVAVSSPNNGILIVNAAQGLFQITIERERLARLAIQDYFIDLVRWFPGWPVDLQERIFEGTATVVEGTTR